MGIAVGFAAVLIFKKAVRSLPVVGGVAKPLLGECCMPGPQASPPTVYVSTPDISATSACSAQQHNMQDQHT